MESNQGPSSLRESCGKKNAACCKQILGSHISYHTNWTLAAQRIFFFFSSKFKLCIFSSVHLRPHSSLQLGPSFNRHVKQPALWCSAARHQHTSELLVSPCQLSSGNHISRGVDQHQTQFCFHQSSYGTAECGSCTAVDPRRRLNAPT